MFKKIFSHPRGFLEEEFIPGLLMSTLLFRVLSFKNGCGNLNFAFPQHKIVGDFGLDIACTVLRRGKKIHCRDGAANTLCVTRSMMGEQF